MAIYHFSVKTISRSTGRSAVAAAAYRSGEKLQDNRYDKEQDYTRKSGVEFKNIYAPIYTNRNLLNRESLWNEAEKAERRKDATLAREFEIAFPQELNQRQREQLLDELCTKLVDKYGVIVDAAIHAPHTKSGSDERNYHAHIMFTSRYIDQDTGTFAAKKNRDFNKEHSAETVKQWREEFANLTNKYLERSGSLDRVNHRSYKDQGIDLEATRHEGNAVTAMKRKYEREQLKPIEERDPKIVMPDLALENNEIRARNAEKIADEEIIKGLDQEIITTNTLLNTLKNSYFNENWKIESQAQETQENSFERNTEPFTDTNQLYQNEKDRLARLEQQIVHLEDNEPPAKKFGIFANKAHQEWEETLKNLKNEKYKLQDQVDSLLRSMMSKPENRYSSRQEVKAEPKKLDFDEVYRSLNQEQKQTYHNLKTMFERDLSGSQLELKLEQVQAKFLEKYKENPNFTVRKAEPDRPQRPRPQEQDIVYTTSKNKDSDRGR